MVKGRCDKFVWYNDYICMTDDKDIIWKHFIKDFIFQHRLRYMVYFRISQNTKSRLIRFFCEYKLYRLCRKYVIIPGLFEPPVRTLRATIPENESHIFR